MLEVMMTMAVNGDMMIAIWLNTFGDGKGILI